jgi:hypothetical protein
VLSKNDAQVIDGDSTVAATRNALVHNIGYIARLAVCPLKTSPPLQCNPLRHVLLTLTSDYIPMKCLWGSVQYNGVTGCVGVWGGL